MQASSPEDGGGGYPVLGSAELGQGRPQDCPGEVPRYGTPSGVSLASGLSPGVFNQGWLSQPCPELRLAVPGVTEHLRPVGEGRGGAGTPQSKNWGFKN